MCLAELRGLGAVYDEIRRQGGTVFALSSDNVADSAKGRAKGRIAFPLLADPECKVIKAYGLLHAGGGHKGQDSAVPAHVLIDREGRITWRSVSARIQDRPDPESVLSAVRGLVATSRPGA